MTGGAREARILRPDQVAALTLDQVVEATRQHAVTIGDAVREEQAGPLELIAFGVTSTLLLGRATALLAQLRSLAGAREGVRH